MRLTRGGVLCVAVFCFYRGVHSLTREIRITGKLSSSQNVIDKFVEIKLEGELVNIPLVRVTGLLSPEFSIVVREGSRTSINDTSPYPVCLYRGEADLGDRELLVAVSLCGEEASGTLVVDGVNYVIKFLSRKKRQVEMDENDVNLDELEIIVEDSKDGVCGINQKNKKKMMVEERPVFRLKRQARRSKRSTKERVIEVAVFVDEEMYRMNEKLTKSEEDPVKRIQDIVFTYLNAVQLIYQSKKLSNRLRLVLVRLDIMKTKNTDLNNHGGDIESYLETFCRWQKKINPGDWRKGDIEDNKHWDHALLLTGLNLYDRQPDQDSVIGLAWVSGMCHPDYSCTINEGNNFESVFVIAHEMGHNLGMNHDGETTEGNLCSPDKFLMSPVLGPGKVTWSDCSNSELNQFLTASSTKDQASCLDDLPPLMDLYDFSTEGLLPGEKFSAMDQCQQAFGSLFRPHVRSDSPFEDLCRELWCSNSTHALRAHPALEGTDCSSKPYPYGSICNSGTCSPFNPNTPSESENEIEGAGTGPEAPESVPVIESGSGGDVKSEPNVDENEIDDSPDWYDPIYTRIFTDLRNKFKEKNPILLMNPNKKEQLSLSGLNTQSGLVFEMKEGNASLSLAMTGGGGAVWHLMVGDCPVECGGGWTRVEHSCEYSGQQVDQEHCDQRARPVVTKLPCATRPCADGTWTP